jgi:hypothetical protein
LKRALSGLESHTHAIACEWRNHTRSIPDAEGGSGLPTGLKSGNTAEAGFVDFRCLQTVCQRIQFAFPQHGE